MTTTTTTTTNQSVSHLQQTTYSMTTSSFLALGTRRTVVFAYAFTLAFMLCTAIVLFHPSGNHLSPSFRSIFLTPSNSNRSHFSSMFSRFLPQNHHLNSSSFSTSFPSSPMTEEVTSQFSEKKDDGVLKDDKNTSAQFSRKPNGTEASNKNNNSLSPPQSSAKNERLPSEREKTSHQISEKNGNNNTSMEMREGNSSRDGDLKAEEQRKENWLDLMGHCDIYDGKWEKDDSYPLYKPGSCPHIDEPFNCFVNGRPDNGYEKYRWQPNNCNIPRLNGRDMLEKLRGKRLVFVGDSLNRNMWESMVCILRDSVIDKSTVFEVSGREEFRTEGSYSFIFKDYNCSVEFFRSPFLVQECEMPDKNGSMKETLRLDIIDGSSDRYKTADVLIFNTGHWWTHEKTSRGEGYYQEGNHVYGQLHVVKAFRKAMTTWGRWVDANINPSKTQVFFRGYSASHFSGGRWNSGGECDSETEPIKKDKYLTKYPRTMKVLESVMKRMKNPVFYLNITRISDYRKDAHPSIYRKQYLTEEERRSPLQYQDCSHWCLPGLPDTWNELVYAQFLFEHNQDQQQQQQKRM